MIKPISQWVSVLLFAASALVFANSNQAPYDEAQDAKAAIKEAQNAAKSANLPLLIVFGANWCGDCKVLDKAMHEGTLSTLMSKDYKVVKVNVGRFDKNLDIAKVYGVPLEKGIPAIALLSPQAQEISATRAGELADARSMGAQGIEQFFKKLSEQAKAKK
jgi:thioredoxin 1